MLYPYLNRGTRADRVGPKRLQIGKAVKTDV